uniref:Uncharacterized protein n=1 Tax=Nelumbo nucifera TaxID=4432 RepID=A0A822ZSQ5_NELNU|nr:TPA_asm: hypothetical protein HUJ06_016362 [Nelumbo nucifera]
MENHQSKMVNSRTREAYMDTFSGLNPFITVFERLEDIVRACSTNPDIEGMRLDPKTCSWTALNECPGSESTNLASSVKQIDWDYGVLVGTGLHSLLVTPLVDGLTDFFIHPSM